MRYLALCSLLVLCGAACKDEDPNAKPDTGSDGRDKDAGTKPLGDAGKDASTSPTQSSLRPSLPRPPSGLPPELRPPR
jgi:hypothetical protein